MDNNTRQRLCPEDRDGLLLNEQDFRSMTMTEGGALSAVSQGRICVAHAFRGKHQRGSRQRAQLLEERICVAHTSRGKDKRESGRRGAAGSLQRFNSPEPSRRTAILTIQTEQTEMSAPMTDPPTPEPPTRTVDPPTEEPPTCTSIHWNHRGAPQS